MSKILVAYFSPGGTTAAAAKSLAQAAGGDLYEIRPQQPYTKADLNWMDEKSRSSIEMKDGNCRPALADLEAPVAGHDIIFLAFPIWWYVAPRIINSFLESYDFSGKRMILFATSGGSGFGKTAAGLKASLSPDARLEEGRMLNGRPDARQLKTWLEDIL